MQYLGFLACRHAGAARPGIPWDGGVGTNVKEVQVRTQGNRKVPQAIGSRFLYAAFSAIKRDAGGKKVARLPLGQVSKVAELSPGEVEWGPGSPCLSQASLCLTWTLNKSSWGDT